MKQISVLIMLLIVQNSFMIAQSKDDENYGKIIYERILNFDNDPQSTMFSLFLYPNFSIFSDNTPQQKEATTLKPRSDDEFDISFEVTLKGGKYIVMTDFEKDSILSQISKFRGGKSKTYIVKEKIRNIKWEVTTESKIISGYKTYKAKGGFRGRQYTAWFTSEIPIKYGPWKLNGLPGLILNVSDDRNEVMFYARKIIIPNISNSKTENFFQFNNEYERISLKEYIKLDNEQVEEFMKFFISKLPRGATYETSNVKTNAIELEYEETIKD